MQKENYFLQIAIQDRRPKKRLKSGCFHPITGMNGANSNGKGETAAAYERRQLATGIELLHLNMGRPEGLHFT
jgi:hypothetical protein